MPGALYTLEKSPGYCPDSPYDRLVIFILEERDLFAVRISLHTHITLFTRPTLTTTGRSKLNLKSFPLRIKKSIFCTLVLWTFRQFLTNNTVKNLIEKVSVGKCTRTRTHFSINQQFRLWIKCKYVTGKVCTMRISCIGNVPEEWRGCIRVAPEIRTRFPIKSEPGPT